MRTTLPPALILSAVLALPGTAVAAKKKPAGADMEPAVSPAAGKPAAGKTAAKPAKGGPDMSLLLAPEKANEKAPKTFKARFKTTKGEFVIEVQRDWSPNGADRFYNMVKSGYLDDAAFFRNVSGFMVQFGINGRPEVSGKWRGAMIQDDPSAGQSNTRGMVTFAMAGPNTRTTQVFISFGNNVRLDTMGFTPFGKVTEGMGVVDKLYNGYGDGAPYGSGPEQGRIQAEGNAFLKKDFPLLDYIQTARLE